MNIEVKLSETGYRFFWDFYGYLWISFTEVNGSVMLIRKDADKFLDGAISKVTSCNITAHDIFSLEQLFDLTR